MRLILSSLAFLSLSLVNQLNAQTKLTQGFEGATFPPLNWQRVSVAGNQFTQNTFNAKSGTKSAHIPYDCGAVDYDWLITPKVTITSGDTLKFWFDPQDYNYPDSFTVRASFTDSLTTSFNMVLAAYKDPSVSGVGMTNYLNGWQQVIIPLDSATFHNQPVFFAIKHWDDCGDGVYYDDFFIGQPAPACSGTPVAGNITPTSVLVCSGSSTSLSVTGATDGAGTSYQWQVSLDNGVLDPWTAVSGGTGATTTDYNTPAITSARYYRLAVTCSNSSQTSFTASSIVGLDSFYSCYAAPGTNGSCWNGVIQSVSTTGTSFNNPTGCSTPYFNKYPISASTTDTFTQLELVQINIGAGSTGDKYALWIDFNRNGVYDASEYQLVANSAVSGINSVNVLIPATAALGLTGMRVRGTWNGNNLGATDAYTNLWDGETEDYLILLAAPPACTGTPSAGTLDSLKTACAGSSAVLSPSGLSVASGLQMQWEESDDNGVLDPWANTSVADTGIVFTTASLTSGFVKYYRLKVTCSNSSLSAYTTVSKVYTDSFYNCYTGVGTNGSCWNGAVSAVSITNGTLNNSTGCTWPTYYTKFPVSSNTTDTVLNGENVQLNVTSTNTGDKYAVWIDYNRNGIFDPTEYTSITTSGLNGVNSVNVLIPNNAGNGLTGMRVRGTWNGNALSNGDAYTSYWDGETEDYFITISPAPVCSGTPTAGTIDTLLTTCVGTNKVIVPTGTTIAAGLTFQWEESDDNGVLDPWAITNAADTLQSFATPNATANFVKYYRLKVTCTASTQTSYTNVSKFYADSFYNCYGLPGTNGSCWDGVFTTTTITNGSLNHTSFCAWPNYYTNVPMSSSTTDTLQHGELIQLNITASSASSKYGAWIDYNRNGIFDATEFTSITASSINGVNSVNILVPNTAGVGLTGIRIRGNSQWGSLTSFDAYTNFWDGVTKDFLVSMEQPPACSGTPSGGTLPATYTTCNGTSVNLSPSGNTVAAGLTYQWEESDDNGVLDPWANTSAADTLVGYTVSVNSLSFVKYYRLKITCTPSAQSAYSSATKVYADSFYNCYVSPGTNGSCWNGDINSVSVVGSSFSNTTSCTWPTYYNKYPISTNTTDTMLNGENFSLVVGANNTSGKYAAWIDYNHNGVFDAAEYTLLTGNISGYDTTVINVPLTAPLGTTGMRIRGTWNGNALSAADAYTNYWDGETEDYLITVDPAPSCTGTPSAGTLNAITTSCVGTTATLLPTGTSVANGLAFQWEESDDNGVLDPWANTSVADTSNTFTTASLLAGFVKYYRLKVTCTTSTQTAYTNATKLYTDSFYNCYSAPGTSGSCWSGAISTTSVTGGTLNNTTVCSWGGPYYMSFPITATTTDTFQTNEVVQFNITAGNSNDRYAMWIDYNHNGAFDATEFVNITGSSTPGVNSVNVAIPPTSQLGLTGIRIRGTSQWNNLGAGDAYTNLWDGETEDYKVRIEAAPLCAGTPGGGTIVDDSVAVCAPSSYVIQVSGLPVVSGIAYQWEESDDNGVLDPWTITSVADTSVTYAVSGVTTSKWFRLKSTCTVSTQTAYSDVIKIIVNPVTMCYCSSNLGGSCWGNQVTDVAVKGTTLNVSSITCLTSGGNNYSNNLASVVANETGFLSKGTTYNFAVTTQNSSVIAAWIDYNANGTYEMSEFVYITSSSIGGSPSYATFTIPGTAVNGKTGMRIRSASTWQGLTASDACSQRWDGSTIDYSVTIGDSAAVPASQASGVTTPVINPNSIVINWNRGTGVACIVVAKLAATPTVEPVNGYIYTASNSYGSGDTTGAGNFVVYRGTGSTVSVFGLANLTNYEFLVYEYNVNGTNYLKPGASSSSVMTPVKWVSFDAKVANKDAVLTWVTASEENNQGFEVLRSLDGVNYVKVGFVKGAGTTSLTQRYRFSDKLVFNTTSQAYYKLRQTDFSGKSSFSNVVLVKSTDVAAQITAYPNPFSKVLNVEVVSTSVSKATIQVTDMNGKLLSENTYSLTEGINKLELNQLAEYAKGVYFVRVVSEFETRSFKVVKE